MLHRLERTARLGTNALSWGIGRNELGMLRFELLQLAHQAVVFGVGDLDIVKRVISIIVVPNLVAQCLDFLGDVRH